MLHEHADVRVIFNEEYPSQGWRTPPERLARRTETLTLLTRSRRPRQSGFLTDVNCCAFRDGPFWLPVETETNMSVPGWVMHLAFIGRLLATMTLIALSGVER